MIKCFLACKKRGKKARGEKGGRKQVAVTLLRKSTLVSMKSQDSKALSKGLTGQVRSLPPVKLASLNLGTGVGDVNICSVYCLQSSLLRAQHFWKPGHMCSPLNFFKNS